MTRILLALAFIGALGFGIAQHSHSTKAHIPTKSSVLVTVGDGHGSGVYIGHGLFLTAAHVATEAKDGEVEITSQGKITFSADVLWLNKDYDVALLRASASPSIEPVKLVCGGPELQPGDYLQSVGNPLNLRNIHTYGVVARSTEGDFPRFVADLTIAPGNSGGPVFDANGHLAGIAVAVSASQIGPKSVALFPLTHIVPVSAICTLLGRA